MPFVFVLKRHVFLVINILARPGLLTHGQDKDKPVDIHNWKHLTTTHRERIRHDNHTDST